jgi:hypothetical protein
MSKMVLILELASLGCDKIQDTEKMLSHKKTLWWQEQSAWHPKNDRVNFALQILLSIDF